jgi:hypothetical protein
MAWRAKYLNGWSSLSNRMLEAWEILNACPCLVRTDCKVEVLYRYEI